VVVFSEECRKPVRRDHIDLPGGAMKRVSLAAQVDKRVDPQGTRRVSAESRLVALGVQGRARQTRGGFVVGSILMNPYTASALPDEGPSIVEFAKVSVNL
jgi:hypothetical protein